MNDSKMSGSIKEEVLRTLPVMCYAEIAEIDAEHEVFLVRHITSGRIGVRKRYPAAVLPVYEYLKKTKELQEVEVTTETPKFTNEELEEMRLSVGDTLKLFPFIEEEV